MTQYEFISLHLTTVKSCRCYEQYWKTIKSNSFPFAEFNYSIEKTLSYRICHQDSLYHFCINCFYEIVLSIPIEIIENENLKGRMGCFTLKNMLLHDCCQMCFKDIIERYSILHFTTI